MTMYTMYAWIVIFGTSSLCLADITAASFYCNPKCKCSPGLMSVWCVKQQLVRVPFIPSEAQRVYLKHNQISVLENISFINTMDIEELDLSYNHIQTADVTAFWNLPNLTVLRMRHNRLQNLPFHVLQSQNKLEILDLSFNQIKALPSDLLRYSSQLRQLNLNNNHLRELPQNMLTNNKKMKVLNLSHNLFQNFYKWRFSDMDKMIYLNLSSVFLSTVYRDMFQGMKNLQVLDLSKNQIHFLDSSSFGGLQSLKKLHLHGNPLDCDCHLNDFINWMKNASSLFTGESVYPACSMPARMRGLSLRDLTTQNLTCQLPQSVKKTKSHRAIMSYQSTDNNQFKSELEPPPYNPWMGVGTACTLSGMLVLFLLCMACDKAKRFYYKKRWERRKLQNRTFHTYTVNIPEGCVDDGNSINVDTVKKQSTIDNADNTDDNAVTKTMINDTKLLTVQVQDTQF